MLAYKQINEKFVAQTNLFCDFIILNCLLIWPLGNWGGTTTE